MKDPCVVQNKTSFQPRRIIQPSRLLASAVPMLIVRKKRKKAALIGKRKNDYKVHENYSKNLNGDLGISSLVHAYCLSSELSLRV